MKKVFLFLFVVMTPLLVACSGDDDDNKGSLPSTYPQSSYENELQNSLFDTSWKFTESVPAPKQSITGTLTFTSDEYGVTTDGVTTYYLYAVDCYNSQLNGDYEGFWYLQDNYLHTYFTSSLEDVSTSAYLGAFFGMKQTIKTINSSQLITEDNYSTRYFTRTSYKESGSGGNSGGGTSSGDAPYVIGYDFTATKTSITYKFDCSERPTSAIVKYGKTRTSLNSSASVDISGKRVTATVSGLSSGTEYYFQCTVSNSYGSSKSGVVKAITNY